MTGRIGIATLVALAAAGTAMGQAYAFPTFNPPQVTSTWQNTALGAAPAGNYTDFIVVFDWTAGGGDPWSSEARSTLSSQPADANSLATPTYPAGNTLYRNNLVGPVGSASSGASQTNMYWAGSLATPYAGGSDLFFNHRQSFGGSAADWSNVRVVLNPTITSTNNLTPLAAPAAYADLGMLGVGNTNISQTLTQGTGAWFRFQVDQIVSDAAGNAFDIFSTGAQDTRMHLFREVSGGLYPVATSDDAAGASNRNAELSFGSADPTSNGRPYGLTSVQAFNGRGGETVVSSIPGMYGGTAGMAQLDPSETYYAWIGFWSGSSLSVTGSTTTFNQVGPTEFTFILEGDIAMGTPTTELDTTIHFMSIPSPSSLALLGMGALFASRRRR